LTLGSLRTALAPLRESLAFVLDGVLVVRGWPAPVCAVGEAVPFGLRWLGGKLGLLAVGVAEALLAGLFEADALGIDLPDDDGFVDGGGLPDGLGLFDGAGGLDDFGVPDGLAELAGDGVREGVAEPLPGVPLDGDGDGAEVPAGDDEVPAADEVADPVGLPLGEVLLCAACGAVVVDEAPAEDGCPLAERVLPAAWLAGFVPLAAAVADRLLVPVPLLAPLGAAPWVDALLPPEVLDAPGDGVVVLDTVGVGVGVGVGFAVVGGGVVGAAVVGGGVGGGGVAVGPDGGAGSQSGSQV
jgi:hypothetical protein